MSTLTVEYHTFKINPTVITFSVQRTYNFRIIKNACPTVCTPATVTCRPFTTDTLNLCFWVNYSWLPVPVFKYKNLFVRQRDDRPFSSICLKKKG